MSSKVQALSFNFQNFFWSFNLQRTFKLNFKAQTLKDESSKLKLQSPNLIDQFPTSKL